MIDEAVVLAAGEGTRLRPLTRNRPKPMLPAANRPILEYVFDGLIDAGITRICTVVGYKHDRVQNHFGSTYRDIPIEYIHQDKQLGSGDALLQAGGAVDGAFLAVNGDQIVTPQIIADVLDEVESDGDAIAKLAVLKRESIGEYGVIELDGDRVTSIIEKPRDDVSHLLNAGVYAFSDEIFDVLEATDRTNGELELPDAISALLESNQIIRAVTTDGLWIDATYPWDLLALAREVLGEGWMNVPETKNDVWIADTATIHDAAELEPPVVIGQDCVIGPGAVVGANTALGRNVTIGANTVIHRSVIDDDTRLDPNSTLIDTVTGQSVKLGAGTMVPGGYTTVTVGGEVHADQRLGAVLADRVRADGAVNITPGSLVGPTAHLHAGGTIRGTIPEGAEVLG